MEPQKNPLHNLEKKRFLYFQIGLVIALGFVLVAFEWKTYDFQPKDLGEIYASQLEEEIIPITIHAKTPPPPPPPKPSPSEGLKIVENHTEVIEEFKKDDEPKVVEEFPDQPEEPFNEPEFYYSVQKMPSFKGCEIYSNESEIQACTNLKIIKFIRDEIDYPEMDSRANREGIVYMSYIINPKGKVEDITILGVKGASKSMVKEATRVLASMPAFNPGIQQGKTVSVQYTQNINFKLR